MSSGENKWSNAGGNKKKEKIRNSHLIVLGVSRSLRKLGGGASNCKEQVKGWERVTTEQTCADVAGVWLNPRKMTLGQFGGAGKRPLILRAPRHPWGLLKLRGAPGCKWLPGRK